MRLVDKFQFYCNSAERIDRAQPTGDFSYNIPFSFDDAPNTYLKFYLQSFVVGNDAVPIHAEPNANNAFTVEVVGGATSTFAIPEGGPSVTQIADWWNQSRDAIPRIGPPAPNDVLGYSPGQVIEQAPNVPGLTATFCPHTGRFMFANTTIHEIEIAGGSAYRALGFDAPGGPNDSIVVEPESTGYSPNLVSVTDVTTIDVECSFGDDRFQTRGGFGTTQRCATAPVLGPFRSDVSYADIVGANGTFQRVSRQQLYGLTVRCLTTTGEVFNPVRDWPFVIACEIWVDDTDVTNGLLREIRDGLKIQDPEPDPSKFPEPPPDPTGLIPFADTHLLSLNDPEYIARQLKRARGV